MNRAIKELDIKCWISGLRKEQSSTREFLPYFHKQNQIYKLYPLLNWSNNQIQEYFSKYNLPHHPLEEKGYTSIGDYHSTSRELQ